MFNFDINLDFLIKNCDGIGRAFKDSFINRFEMLQVRRKRTTSIAAYPQSVQSALNKILAKISSVNYPISDVIRYNIIRLYLIRSYRGRSQALGKPSRGQRT